MSNVPRAKSDKSIVSVRTGDQANPALTGQLLEPSENAIDREVAAVQHIGFQDNPQCGYCAEDNGNAPDTSGE